MRHYALESRLYPLSKGCGAIWYAEIAPATAVPPFAAPAACEILCRSGLRRERWREASAADTVR